MPEAQPLLSLPLSGMQVIQLQIDYRLSFLLDGGALIALSGLARLTQSSVSEEVIPERHVNVLAAIDLLFDTVASAVAAEDGTLTVAFNSNRTLSVSPDDDYEAWELAGPGEHKVVCLPGGGLATWGFGT